MTDRNDQTSAQPRRSQLTRAGLPVAAVLVLAAVVYGMTWGAGKKGGADTACAAASQTATRISPLAKGQIAALSVHKSPPLAQDVAFEGPDGSAKKLSDFRGKTVLLNLWATWCAPCRAEMPALDRLQGRAGGENFEVVAVNIDTARLERRKTFLNSVGVKNLAFYADPKADVFQALKQAGKVVGLPTTILIGPEGCELGIMAGPAEWDSPEALALIQTAVAGAGDKTSRQN